MLRHVRQHPRTSHSPVRSPPPPSKARYTGTGEHRAFSFSGAQDKYSMVVDGHVLRHRKDNERGTFILTCRTTPLLPLAAYSPTLVPPPNAACTLSSSHGLKPSAFPPPRQSVFSPPLSPSNPKQNKLCPILLSPVKLKRLSSLPSAPVSKPSAKLDATLHTSRHLSVSWNTCREKLTQSLLDTHIGNTYTCGVPRDANAAFGRAMRSVVSVIRKMNNIP